MTPETLEAAMRRAGVGQYENMTGTPYPYRSRLEEAEAIVAELPPLTYIKVWRAWEAFESKAADRGNGATQDQMTGASLMLGFLLDHYLAAAEPAKEGAE